MKVNKKQLIFVVVGIINIFLNTIIAQDSLYIGVTGFRSPDSIILTWQPRDFHDLVEGFDKGYEIEKYEMNADQLDFTKATRKTYSVLPSTRKNSTAIRAFLLGNESNKNILGMDELRQVEALQNRFSFILMAGYSSPSLLEDLGLRWVDKDIKLGKMYYYIIKPGYNKLNKGKVLLMENSKLPPVTIQRGKEQNDYVEIIWSKSLMRQYYYGFEIQRSKDGINYKTLNENKPIVGFSTPGVTSDNINYIDSLPLYDPYYYRIVGLSIYGIKSEPSDPILLQCRDRIAPPPVGKLTYTWLGDTLFTLRWENEDAKDLKGHYIQRCKKITENDWEYASDELIPGHLQQYSHKTADKKKSYFYRVVSIDTANNYSFSSHIKVILLDSIPPKRPKGLKGIIDTSGIVTLSWESNSEEDLNGYYVYYTNKNTHLYNSLMGYPIKGNSFRDTITLKTHTEVIFYRIAAVDFNYNYSEYSDVIELKKPDKVPPSPPVFYKHSSIGEHISLAWHRSSAKDVVKYLLYRKEGSAPMMLYKEFDKSVIEYEDKEIKKGVQYLYEIVAEDDAGLKSKVAFPVLERNMKIAPLDPPSNFKASYDEKIKKVILSWDATADYKYAIYKARDENALVNIAYTKVNEVSYTDADLSKTKQQYSYAVAAISPDQRKSKLSEIVKIKIKKK